MQTHPLRPACVCGLGLAIVVLVSPAAHAQGSGGSPVRVEFRAASDDGQPVSDLKPSDVSLKLNGKPRELRALHFVKLPEASAAAAPSAPAFATNAAGAAGRTIVIVLDEESVAPGKEQPLRDALAKLLDSLSTNDRVGLTSVRRGAPQGIPPTTDQAKVRTAVADLRGFAQSETASDFQCRTSVTLQALREMLAGPALTPQTIFLFVSAGMSLPPPPARVGQSSGLCQLETRQFEEVGNAAAASPAAIFVAYYVDGMSSPTSESLAGVENVAGVVQTTLLRLAGSNVDALTKIVKVTSGHYVVSFEPDAAERNGASHRLELRVARDRVRVRAPSAIVIPKGGKAPSPRDMLRVATLFPDLPLRAVALSSRNPGDDKIKVIALVEAAEPDTKLTGAAVGFYDEKGKLAAQWTAQDADLSRPIMMAAVTLPPGTYRLRAAGVDASGRAGAADGDVNAALVSAGPLKLSAPMLGVLQGGNFAPRLQFGASDGAAIGYIEIYGVPANGNISATLELAPSEDAPAMATATTQVQGKDDMRAAFGGFDISRLQPGDYVLRALVSLDGKVVGRTLRTLRKTE